MVTRSFKLASISFLTFSLLLGAHQFRLHAHDHGQHLAQVDNLQRLQTGPATMYQTNAFGMPGVDSHSLHTTLNDQAAANGISPPTSTQAATLHTQSVAAKEQQASKPWYSYIGLLGLLGLLGISSRSASA